MFLLFSSSPKTFAQQTAIGPETSIPLPPDAAWSLDINFRPTSNEVVNFNPPLFAWCYVPGGASTVAQDAQQYSFVLQVANDKTFANPAINIQTTCNFYNFLPPLQNTNGTIYWRVGYISVVNNTTNAWITNTFQFSGTATNWDRSGFATLASSKAVHPYLLINNSNASAISTWLSTNSIPWVNTEWTQCQVDASNCWSQPWYQHGFSAWGQNSANILAGHYLTDAAFMWRLTTNSYWTNQSPTPMDVLTNYANWYITNLYDQVDDVSTWDPFPETIPQFGFLYDWFYDAMDAKQRQVLLNLIHDYSSFILYGYNWDAGSGLSSTYSPGTNRTYPPPYHVFYGSDLKAGQSHQHQVFETRYPLMLAAFNDDAAASNAWVVGCNYYLAVGFYDGHNGGSHQPRDYNQTAMYGPGAVPLMTWVNSMFTGSVFPESHIDYNPFFHLTAQFTEMLTPVQFYQLNDPWADGSESMVRNCSAEGEGFSKAMQMMAMLTGDGMAQSHWANQNAATGDASDQNFTYKPYAFLLPYYYPPPTPTTNTTLTHVFPVDGWVEAVSSPPNQPACFSSGVGIVFMARPGGMSMGSHSTPCDGNFQIWAYGANITDSGEFYNDYQARYGRTSWAHYLPTVDGIGQLQNPDAMTAAWYSRIIAFTNAPDYVFWGADLTKAYPVDQRSAQDLAGGGPYGMWPVSYLQLATQNPFPDVTAIQRYILFNHHKYFAIYDSFASVSNHLWSEPYHIMENTLTNDSGATFTYVCTNQITGLGTQPVTVYVFQCVNPSLLAITNMTGTNVKGNPITGENYYYLTPGDPYVRTTAKWISSAQKTNNFHLLTIIYPVPPGGSIPQFTRLDDYTVAITNGSQGDVIGFNPNTTNATTLLINEPAIAATAGIDTNVYPGSSYLPTQPVSVASSGIALTPPTGFHFVPPPAVNGGMNVLSPSAFMPPPGYFAWWNPDSLSGGDFATVPSWMDLSTNNLVAFQSDIDLQPILRVAGQNRHNYLAFNGEGVFLRCVNSGSISGPMEVFVVEKEPFRNGGKNVFLTDDAQQDAYSFRVGDFQGGFSEYLLMARDGSDMVYTSSFAPTNWLVVTAILNGSNSQLLTNGVLAAAGTVQNSARMTGIDIGGSPLLGVYHNGQIADIIIYTNIISKASEQSIETGLRQKYGF